MCWLQCVYMCHCQYFGRIKENKYLFWTNNTAYTMGLYSSYSYKFKFEQCFTLQVYWYNIHENTSLYNINRCPIPYEWHNRISIELRSSKAVFNHDNMPCCTTQILYLAEIQYTYIISCWDPVHIYHILLRSYWHIHLITLMLTHCIWPVWHLVCV